MSQAALPREIVLGQPVLLRTGGAEKRGCIVAIMLTYPYEALVRWHDAEATFEALDTLVDAP